MPSASIFVEAIGGTPGASLAQYGIDPALASAKYLRIDLPTGTGSAVFEVIGTRRMGATGPDIYLQPGQLGLAYGARSPASATPVSRWAYRLEQLSTPTGILVLGVLVAAVTAAWIDGSETIGKAGLKLFFFQSAVLRALELVSLTCKLASAVFAFLLALWFKK